MDIITAIKTRHSTRAFLPTAVPNQIIEQILEAARFAPSGANMQPWRVAVVQGNTKQQLSTALLAARANDEPERPDYEYYPTQWFSPYQERRRACGLSLYQALNVTVKNKAARMQAWNNNYHFFGAPVGLLIFIDQRLGLGSWLDTGIFMQNIMLAAQNFNLGTCAQAALAQYPDIVRQLLNIESHWQVVAGLSLGYADREHPVNQYRVPRESVAEFTQWYD